MTNGLQALAVLGVCFALCWLGKRVYALFHPGTPIERELTARDNLAFAIPLGGYYLAILIVLGGPVSGASHGSLARDLVAVLGWGIVAVALLNLASLVTQRVLFRRLDMWREIVEGNNVAAGIVMAGSHVANALLVLGALGDEGGLAPAAVFWLYAQVLLIVATRAFMAVVGYDLAGTMTKQNVAAGFTLFGLLVALGNVLRMSITGPFEGWASGFATSTGYALVGLILLFVIRWLTDLLLFPGVTIRHEVMEQEVPNVGVGYIEAVFYIGASLLIGWSL
jgi:uncharacterized membrane protein YjfL (UPF0719 family)